MAGLGSSSQIVTGVLAPEAAEAFSEMGMFDAAKVLREAMGVFGEPYPRDRAERVEFMETQYSDSAIVSFQSLRQRI